MIMKFNVEVLWAGFAMADDRTLYEQTVQRDQMYHVC